MNKNMTQTKLIPSTALLIAFFALAGVSGAYTIPSQTAPGGNTLEPFNVGVVDHVKPAGLSVNTFTARANALFSQKVTFDGLIRGGIPTDVNSVINIGGTSTGTTYNVAVQAEGTLRANLLHASTLTHTGGDQQICSDANGNIILCLNQYTSGTPSIQEVHGYSYSGNGNSFPDTVLCNVRLTSASSNDETFTFKYRYEDPAGDPGLVGECTLTVPVGTTYGETEVFPPKQPNRVISICVSSGTMNITGGYQC
jgi:hypothetical protein